MDVKDTKNRRLKDEIIDHDMYKNLLAMLNSTEEDRYMALKSLNQLDKKKNLAAILFLRRNSEATDQEWKDNASTVDKYHKSLYVNSGIIKHIQIYEAIKNQKVHLDHNIEVFKFYFEDFLNNTLAGMSADFIAEIKVKVNLKLPELNK